MIRKIQYDKDELSEKSREYFENGWMMNDLRGYWCSKEAILDHIHDMSDGEISLDEVPESWWEECGITGEMRKTMEELWAENEFNEVEWQ